VINIDATFGDQLLDIGIGQLLRDRQSYGPPGDRRMQWSRPDAVQVDAAIEPTDVLVSMERPCPFRISRG
jgi:hypothetical protein